MSFRSKIKRLKRFIPAPLYPCFVAAFCAMEKVFSYPRVVFDRFAKHSGLAIMRFNLVHRLLRIRITFFDLFANHYQFTKPLLIRVAEKERVLLLVTTLSHPAWTDASLPANVRVILIRNVKGPVLKQLNVKWLVTPASHLHPTSIPDGAKTVHLYHSPVSMHVVYGDDAFDGYSHFFACGPHHLREISSLAKQRHWGERTVLEVGYPKIDELALQYARSPERGQAHAGYKTFILAPSWHTENLLKLHGVAIAETVLNMGHNLVIRPHPHSYDYDQDTLAQIREIAERHPGRCILEGPVPSLDTLWQGDILISDWSGVAYEYAFATERPVLFIDSPQKINSSDWQSHGLPAMEDVCRHDIGLVVDSHDRIAQGLNAIMATSSKEWAEKIKAVRQNYLFNFGNSANIGARYLHELAEGIR